MAKAREVLAATLALLALSAALASSATSEIQQTQTRPNIVVLMTDDQTVESMRVMTNVNTLLAARGTTFTNNFASFPLCCPSRSTYITGQYGHNHTIMGNAPPAGGYEKLAPTHSNTLPAWLRAAGYHTVHVGKYLNGYGRARPTEIPAGWTRVVRLHRPLHLQLLQLPAERERPARDLRDRRCELPDGRLRAEGRRADSPACALDTAVLPLGRRSSRRTAAGRVKPAIPRIRPRRLPAPRHRNRFASEPLPAPASFNEADVSDKPTGIRNRALIGPARVNGIRENYQQRLESLLAVDEAIRDIVAALDASGEMNRHADRVHLRQRVLPRRAPRSGREGARVRAVGARPADHPRPRRACAAPAGRASSRTSTWRRPSSTLRTPAPGGGRTAARCCRSRTTGCCGRAGTSCWRRRATARFARRASSSSSTRTASRSSTTSRAIRSSFRACTRTAGSRR